MKRYHIYISGFVQGVGFRWYTKSLAKKLGMQGYAKNLSDGRVEVTIECEEDSLKNLIVELKNGDLGKNISDIETIEETSTQEFNDFRIEF